MDCVCCVPLSSPSPISAPIHHTLSSPLPSPPPSSPHPLFQLLLFMDKLNVVAPIATIFYLLSYAGVNIACFTLRVASAPNFRYRQEMLSYVLPVSLTFHLAVCMSPLFLLHSGLPFTPTPGRLVRAACDL